MKCFLTNVRATDERKNMPFMWEKILGDRWEPLTNQKGQGQGQLTKGHKGQQVKICRGQQLYKNVENINIHNLFQLPNSVI